MQRTMIVGAYLLVLVLIGSPVVIGGQMPMGSHGGQQEQSSGQPSMMGREMTGMPMMSMMCPMMGGMMGGQMDPSGMMSMMGGGQMDPKAMAQMLQLRGDMLKAIGDVLLKHSQAMREGQ
jgi:hypothetical protein